MWRLLLLFCFTTSSAFAEQQLTAYQAMKTVGRQLDRAALARIISVTGVDGDPQPTRWNILLVDRKLPGGVREIQVVRGRIAGSGAPAQAVTGSTQGATLSTAKLNLDSDGAFKVASYTADRSHVNFSSVSYTLRTNERGLPVWVVTLQDDNRQSLGTIVINANKGSVTRVENLYRGSSVAQAEQNPAEARGRERPVEQPPVDRTNPDEYADASGNEETDEDDGDVNPVKAEIKRRWRQTREGVRGIFFKARRSFADFVNRD